MDPGSGQAEEPQDLGRHNPGVVEVLINPQVVCALLGQDKNLRCPAASPAVLCQPPSPWLQVENPSITQTSSVQGLFSCFESLSATAGCS